MYCVDCRVCLALEEFLGMCVSQDTESCLCTTADTTQQMVWGSPLSGIREDPGLPQASSHPCDLRPGTQMEAARKTKFSVGIELPATQLPARS